ncbi:MAG: efflux RND transporter permease subunit [Photobacterium aquimaris]|nr:efflux RND transporter permease subunit [Photobacterium aquimaris]
MSFIYFSLKNKTVTHFFTMLIMVVGIAGFMQMSKLEDPDFTVKTGLVLTPYPGASPQEVEDEVTDPLEKAIAELPHIYHTYSMSRAGLSIITIDISEEYWADRISQVWDDIRKKVTNAQSKMPNGVSGSQVLDDFSFVYGFVLSLTGDGYSQKELENYAHAVRRELALVQGVSRVELWGDQQEAIYLNVSPEKLAEINISPMTFARAVGSQNEVVSGGSATIQGQRLRISPSGNFLSANDIGELMIAPGSLESIDDQITTQGERSKSLLRIRDVAEVEEGVLTPTDALMRFNNAPALALMIANQTGGNVIETGSNLDSALIALEKRLPAGITLNKISWQSDLVNTATDNFMISLMQAVFIVVGVLLLSMGLRMGLLIGANLMVVIMATFLVMAAMGIDLHRVSLGSLIIAMGMMVDNAIVVAEGYVIRVQQGMDKMKAAVESAGKPMLPLLGATVIACMAFYPVFASPANAGEYGRSLFLVVGISLVLSWIMSISLTPLWCQQFLKAEPQPKRGLYQGPLYQLFRKLLTFTIKRSGLFVTVMTVMLIGSVMIFQSQVKLMFFPEAQRPQLMVDFWFPMGKDIEQTSMALKGAEQFLQQQASVDSVSSFVGSGAPRFYLPVNPELPYSNYAQLIVNTKAIQDPDRLVVPLEQYLAKNYPEIMTRVRKYSVGPSDTWKLEWRIVGPADADRQTLRDIAQQYMQVLDKSPWVKEVKTDMMSPVRMIEPQYDMAQGRWSGLTRSDLAATLQYMTDGTVVGQYREGDRNYPILVRLEQNDYQRYIESMDTLMVAASDPMLGTTTIPLGQIAPTHKFVWEDPILVRWDRKPAITIQGTPHNTTYPDMKDKIWHEISQIPLPPGYSVFYDGENLSTSDAQQSLKSGGIVSGIIVISLLVLMLNSIRKSLMLLMIVPFVLIGITLGLLISGLPFEFMALLGAMSLVGMMLKNGIVLLDEVNHLQSQGVNNFNAIVDATVSRIRPVLLAAGTTVLGVIPLYSDPFWASMSVTIMAGLTVGTLVTLLLLPALYALMYRIKVLS